MTTQLETSYQGGEWFLKSRPFLDWKDEGNRILWCPGTYGTGKTVLASIVEGHLRQQPGVGVATVYFKYDAPGQTLEHTLKSILEQLAKEQPNALESRPPLESILLAVETYSKVFIIVDAIDQCNDETRLDLIGWLRNLPSEIRFMVTSREQCTTEIFKNFQSVDVKANPKDIELHIDQRIRGDSNLRAITEGHPTIRDDIKRAVVNAAGDSFLLARLQLESLVLAATSIRGVNMELQNLPTELSSAYEKVVERVREQNSDEIRIAVKALQWISHACRALSLEELQHALATEVDGTNLDEKQLIDGDRITALCGGLVVVEGGVVRLINQTAAYYFKRHFEHIDTGIALSCAACLDALKDSDQETLEKYHLAKYAADYMGNHADLEKAPENLSAQVISYLLSRSDGWEELLSLLDSFDLPRCRYSYTDSSAQTKVTPIKHCPPVLQLAASIGIAHAAITLLKNPANTVTLLLEGTIDINTFAAAYKKGIAAAFAFLINNGGRVDLRDDRGVQMFLAIVSNDWRDAADIISQKANSADESQASPDRVQLLLAVYDGDKTRTEENIHLVEKDRNVGATALFIAVERDHPDIVRILLDAGVDIDSKDSRGQTALHRATRRGSKRMVEALLGKGAGVDIKDDEGKTAWSSNAHNPNKTLSLLLAAGANPNTTGPDGVSLLYTAACSGKHKVVNYLLKSGANPSIKTKYGWTPLHWAAGNGHFKCVELLIRAGAETSPLSDTRLTPLDLALSRSPVWAGLRESGVLRALKEAGAQRGCDIPDSVEQAAARDVVTNYTAHTDSEAKTALVFDRPMGQELPFGQFIYHIDGRGGCYEISHPLDTELDSISISHSNSDSRPDSSEYPLGDSHFNPEAALYHIKATQPNHPNFEISSAKGGDTFIMRLSCAVSWEAVRLETDGTETLYLRAAPDWCPTERSHRRWDDSHGKLVARMCIGQAPELMLENELDPTFQHVLVACHVAKIWWETSQSIIVDLDDNDDDDDNVDNTTYYVF